MKKNILSIGSLSAALGSKPYSFSLLPFLERFQLNAQGFSRIKNFPAIELVSSHIQNGSQVNLYKQMTENILEIVLPPSLFNSSYDHDSQNIARDRAQFQALLPLMSSTMNSHNFFSKFSLEKIEESKETYSKEISFYILSRYQPNSFKFFFNMISHWLIPEKSVHVVTVFTTDFRLKDICDDIYTICEIKILVHSENELVQIKQNLPLLESEIRLGMHSPYYAHKILEIKGLSSEQKTALLHHRIASLIKRRPKDFDFDLLVEMQHTLITCSDEFKQCRSLSHLSRLISLHYLFRKEIVEALKEEPTKRYFKLKIFKTRLAHRKPILGIIIGINFLRATEIFDQRHLLNAIKLHLPNVEAVKDSFYANRLRHASVGTFYLEISKADQTDFSYEEMLLLRQELPHDLQEHVETPIHPIFMPRNEEEIMRNIVLLCKELNSLKAPPQAIITFDEQTASDLFFTVIVLRIISEGNSLSLEQIFCSKPRDIEYIHDRCRLLTRLNDNFVKEATVFRLKLSKSSFLRRDFSVDLVQARLSVAEELSDALGYYRDFNGGTIAKEREALQNLKMVLKGTYHFSEIQLENYFHNILPAYMRSTLESAYLKELFLFLLSIHKQNKIKNNFPSQKYQLSSKTLENTVYIILRGCDNRQRTVITRVLQETSHILGKWASSFAKIQHSCYGCFLFHSTQLTEQQSFIELIEQSLNLL